MGFILNGLDTEDYDRQYGDRVLLQRIIGYFKPYTRQMILVAVMITLNSLAGTGTPILIARAILPQASSCSSRWAFSSLAHRPGCLTSFASEIQRESSVM